MEETVSIAALWLPVLVSSAVVFVVSFVIWMVLGHHKPDFKMLPDEEAVLGAARGLEPGQYFFPCCDDMSKMKDPVFKEKWLAGPHGTLVVRAGSPNMGKNLLVTFIFYVVVSITVGYIGGLALDRGADFMSVFRVTGAAGVAAYVFGAIPNAIWFGRPVRAMVTDTIDGIIYALATGAIFAWLWPATQSPIV